MSYPVGYWGLAPQKKKQYRMHINTNPRRAKGVCTHQFLTLTG